MSLSTSEAFSRGRDESPQIVRLILRALARGQWHRMLRRHDRLLSSDAGDAGWRLITRRAFGAARSMPSWPTHPCELGAWTEQFMRDVLPFDRAGNVGNRVLHWSGCTRGGGIPGRIPGRYAVRAGSTQSVACSPAGVTTMRSERSSSESRAWVRASSGLSLEALRARVMARNAHLISIVH